MDFHFLSAKDQTEIVTAIGRQAEHDQLVHTTNAAAFRAAGNAAAADQQDTLAAEAAARVAAAIEAMPPKSDD